MLRKLQTLSTLKSKNTNELLAKKIMLTLVAGACFFAVQNPVMAAEITIEDATVLPAAGISSGGLTCSAVGSSFEIIHPTATGDSLVINAPTADYSLFNFVGKYLVSGDVTDGSITLKNGNVGYISGGESWSGATVKNNSVIIKGGTINDVVYGGFSKDGEASGNTVEISDGTIKGEIDGGIAIGDKAASNNSVNISGGTINGNVSGGWSSFGEASDNKVEISGGEVKGWVYGGYSNSSKATANEVEISGDATIIDGNVFGGYANGDKAVSNNSVIIKGATINIDVLGGFSAVGEASDNTVEISGGTIKGVIYGGYANGDKAASNNSVIIKGGTINDAVNGGYSKNGEASGNKVTISGGTFEGEINGGSANGDKVASNNSVIIKDGTINADVNGGYSEYGEASGNTVEISGGTFEGMINGGSANGDKAASNNSVIIKGGTINEDVWGGYSRDGEASGNTVEISGDATIIDGDVYAGASHTVNAINNTVNLGGGEIKGCVYGGYSVDATKDFTTGNTLKVSGLDIKALNIKNFENIYFFIPNSATNDSTMLNLTDTADTNISATNLKAGVVAIEGDSKLKAGDTVNLIKKDAGTLITKKTDGKEMTYGKLTATEGVSVEYEFDILKQDDKTLVATINAVHEPSLNPQTKSLAETQLAGMGLLTSGMDMLSGAGIANAVEVTDGAGSEFTLVGQIGVSDMKHKTGSHVDLNGWNLGLGFAKTTENNAGKLTFGTIVGYGKGSYDSYVDRGIHGEGDTDYLGISLFAHQANEDGLYYEGSIGAGRVNSDYKSNDLVGAGGAKVHESYDSDSTYVAAHLGLGKKIEVSDKAKLDVYGKYFYAHQGGDDAKLATGETYHFDAVDSNRIRLGARYEIENGKAADSGKALNTLYVGTAYEYEFSGDAKATYKGMETASPSLKGSSGMLELGWKVKPSAASPLTIDLSANGWCGQKEGYGLKANLLWNF